MIRASLFAIIVFARTAAAQQPVPVPEISGVLLDEHDSPIRRPASVVILPCGRGDVDDEGNFRVKCNPEPVYVKQYITVIPQKDGWVAQARPIPVPPGGALLDPVRMRLKSDASMNRTSRPVAPGASIEGSLTLGGDAYAPTLSLRVYNPNPRRVFLKDLEVHVDGVDEIQYGLAVLKLEPSNTRQTGDVRLSTTGSDYFVSEPLEKSVDAINGSDPFLFSISDNSTRGDLDHVYRLHAEITWRDGSVEKRTTIERPLLILLSGQRNRAPADSLVSSTQQQAEHAMAAGRDVLNRLSAVKATRSAALQRLTAEVRSFQPRDVLAGVKFDGYLAGTVDTARLFVVAGLDIEKSPTARYMLHSAVLNRNWDLALFFLDRGVKDLNLKDEWRNVSFGEAALASVATAGETRVASALIGNGVKASAAFVAGAKPAVVRLALDAGGEPPKNYYCSTVLGLFEHEGAAIETHKPDDFRNSWPESRQIATLLIERGVPVNEGACGVYQSVIAAAAGTGQIDLLKKFLTAARGTRIVGPPELNSIAYSSLSCKPEYREEVLRVLLDAGADFSKMYDFLHRLTPEIARMLVKYGWDVNYPSEDPPLVDAARRGDIALVDTLLELGAQKGVPGRDWERGFAGYLENKRLDVIKCLIKAGADVNHQVEGELVFIDLGRTYQYRRATAFPVILAAAQADVPLMRVLLEAGADAHAKSSDPYVGTVTALEQTVVHRPISFEILGMLLERQPDLCAKVEQDYYVTPLIFCAAQKDVKCVRSLLAAGADPNGRGCASLAGSVPLNYELPDETRKILIEAGAVPSTNKKK